MVAIAAKTSLLPATDPIRPIPGPQAAFLSTPADIAVYGGAAGAGKSFALLMEPLRHLRNPQFGAVIFRRTFPQISAQGGLWDTSELIYPKVGGIPKNRAWTFRSGSVIKFAHLQLERDKFNWDGSQVPLICWDQLEHFTWTQFTYLLSRNRSLCGVRPYTRATCNPDPDHWLRRFMGWWINETTGFPIKERSGRLRYFINRDNETMWADTKEELHRRYGRNVRPLSFTFIPGTVEDNPILLREDPDYLAKLEGLTRVDRDRLRWGNWNARVTGGTLFQRAWFNILPAAPQCVRVVRYWDRAATQDRDGVPIPGASWTAGVKLGLTSNGHYVILDVVRFQAGPLEVERGIKNTAAQDGQNLMVVIEQDPGQAGKAEAQIHVRNLAGYNVRTALPRGDKVVRAKGFSAQVESGNVSLVRGRWNDAYLTELENFDGSKKHLSDQTDASSGAFNTIVAQSGRLVW